MYCHFLLQMNSSSMISTTYQLMVLIRVHVVGLWWEVLNWFDSEAAVRASGAAETVDYSG